MRRRVLAVAAFLVATLAANRIYADPVRVGDSLHFLGTDGTIYGGAFAVDDLATGPGIDFYTFCVQLDQDINYDDLFVVGSISDAADDAGGPNPLRPEAAWLYWSYRHGTLPSLTSDEIQAAIWYLQGDVTLTEAHLLWGDVIGDPDAVVALAHQQVLDGWSNDGRVQVLNMFYLDGTPAQDQLVLNEVPEPATMLLVGGGIVALARRRSRRSRAAA
jgi:hypothetical protein